MDEVTVFVDYQNVHGWARRKFLAPGCDPASGHVCTSASRRRPHPTTRADHGSDPPSSGVAHASGDRCRQGPNLPRQGHMPVGGQPKAARRGAARSTNSHTIGLVSLFDTPVRILNLPSCGNGVF